MKATCLIADDEPFAVQLLQKHITDSGLLVLSGTCSTALEVSAFLNEKRVDLLFLDIEMPKISGIELLKILKDPPAVIITTAYREYAIQGYEFEIIDYLLKPITFERFLAAIEKFNRRRRNQIQSPTQAEEKAEKYIKVKSGVKIYQLNQDDILYLESSKDFVQINLTNGKKLLIKYKLGQLENELATNFLRIHKSFIVNKNRVTVFYSTHLELDKIILPIGSSYRPKVERIFEN
ncbi:LytTR family DNA-binding domain-containing protein [Algoriphagus confluentis]|uniref:LytTR family DNA-binding domain-containing protein n=1 Tax=Algoriphagus confluentis TaxID=1697556 RepID=A0ABQ6PS33_9BACT|nr:LytTR family DNA-binding domain-containing protein [Algoriphagus confluentis]